MEKKIYSAFVSSVFETLRDERNEVISCLLDHRILPICMEHFTVSTSGKFSDIEALIDDSDIFIMLLGKCYGSTDEEGISWTEREFLYASKKHKHIIAIICDELSENFKLNKSDLTYDELRQIEFCKKIGFSRTVSKDFSINTIINQALNGFDMSKSIGWTRIEDDCLYEETLLKWQNEHKVYDLSGVWHHVHLSDEDEDYIRIGTIKITQDFTPKNYLDLHFEGINFSVMYYNNNSQSLVEDKMKSSKFVGEYKMEENGKIFGIFRSKRLYNGKFNSQNVDKGERRGIHDFSIDVFEKETLKMDGEFHDEAPSPKLGRIFVFRSVKERDQFVLINRENAINRR